MRKIVQLMSRWRRLRKITREVARHSRQLFPQERLAWTMVAEDRTEECVVYVTYERSENASGPVPHRFFRVRLPELTVSNLQSEYYPAQWGPYH